MSKHGGRRGTSAWRQGVPKTRPAGLILSLTIGAEMSLYDRDLSFRDVTSCDFGCYLIISCEDRYDGEGKTHGESYKNRRVPKPTPSKLTVCQGCYVRRLTNRGEPTRQKAHVRTIGEVWGDLPGQALAHVVPDDDVDAPAVDVLLLVRVLADPEAHVRVVVVLDRGVQRQHEQERRRRDDQRHQGRAPPESAPPRTKTHAEEARSARRPSTQ